MDVFDAFLVAGLVAASLLGAMCLGWRAPLPEPAVGDAGHHVFIPATPESAWAKEAAFWRDVRARFMQEGQLHRDHDNTLDAFVGRTTYWVAPVFDEERSARFPSELQVWGEAIAENGATMRTSCRHAYAALLADFMPGAPHAHADNFAATLMDAILEIDKKLDAWKLKATHA